MVSVGVKPIYTDVNMFGSRTKFVRPVESNILSQKSQTTGGEGEEGEEGEVGGLGGEGKETLASRAGLENRTPLLPWGVLLSPGTRPFCLSCSSTP